MCPFGDEDVVPFDDASLYHDDQSEDALPEDSEDDRELEDYDVLDDDDDDYDDEDDDFDDDDLDDLEDASDEEVDLVVALYNDDGERVGVPLESMLANDLDEMITQLGRLPGDAGAVGMISIDHFFFVIVRVRGRNVQVFLSDAVAGNDWPIARDVVDYLGEDIPDPDDDSEPIGDFDLLADAGISEFDMEAFADLDEDSDEVLSLIAARINYGRQFEQACDGVR